MTAATSAAKLDGIEACRGVAGTAVVLYHAARHLDKAYDLPGLRQIFLFGHAGVDLFFVISGFIILFVHNSDIGHPARVGRYVARRLTRILPTFWVALGITLAMGAAGGHGWPSPVEIAWSATLLPSFDEPLLGVAWTLQCEVVFYAMFCVLIASRRAGTALFVLWFATIAAGTIAGSTLGLPRSVGGAFSLEFLLGMLAADWLRNRAVPSPRLLFAVGTTLFVATAVAEDFGLLDGYADPARLAYGGSAALIVLGLAAGGRSGVVTVPAILRSLGTASYSIYLFQFVFIGVVWKLWLAARLDRWLPHEASFPLLVLAAIGGGVAVSRSVEHPLMRLVRRRRAASRAVVAAP